MIANLAAHFRREQTVESPVLALALGVGEQALVRRPADEAGDAALDSAQRSAYANAVGSDCSLVLVQGPPGTGKTHVLEATLRQLASGGRILVTAPSNAAVDNVCRRVRDLAVLRLGRDERSIASSHAGLCRWRCEPC